MITSLLSHACRSKRFLLVQLVERQGKFCFCFRSPVDTKIIFNREKLSDLLNPEKVLYSEEGYARDWRGLFEISGLSQSDCTLISQSPDKTQKLLDLWLRRNKDNNKEITLSQLLHCLGLIDRYDVYDDTYLLLSK